MVVCRIHCHIFINYEGKFVTMAIYSQNFPDYPLCIFNLWIFIHLPPTQTKSLLKYWWYLYLEPFFTLGTLK